MTKNTQWVLVETVHMFVHRYMVETPMGKEDWALDSVVSEEAKEFSQKSLGESIVNHRVVTLQEALDLFRNSPETNYLSDWSDEKIIECYFTPFVQEINIDSESDPGSWARELKARGLQS
jgi:hypothetical protein